VTHIPLLQGEVLLFFSGDGSFKCIYLDPDPAPATGDTHPAVAGRSADFFRQKRVQVLLLLLQLVLHILLFLGGFLILL